MSENSIGYVGIDKDYFVSVKEVLNITAETGALETQDRVRDLPPADVEPKRPKGEWLEYVDNISGASYGLCPVCKQGTLYAISYDLTGKRHIMNFCPKCGADMRGNKE